MPRVGSSKMRHARLRRRATCRSPPSAGCRRDRTCVTPGAATASRSAAGRSSPSGARCGRPGANQPRREQPARPASDAGCPHRADRGRGPACLRFSGMSATPLADRARRARRAIGWPNTRTSPPRDRVGAEDRARHLGAAGADQAGTGRRSRRRAPTRSTSATPFGALSPFTARSDLAGLRAELAAGTSCRPCGRPSCCTRSSGVTVARQRCVATLCAVAQHRDAVADRRNSSSSRCEM